MGLCCCKNLDSNNDEFNDTLHKNINSNKPDRMDISSGNKNIDINSGSSKNIYFHYVSSIDDSYEYTPSSPENYFKHNDFTYY